MCRVESRKDEAEDATTQGVKRLHAVDRTNSPTSVPVNHEGWEDAASERVICNFERFCLVALQPTIRRPFPRLFVFGVLSN